MPTIVEESEMELVEQQLGLGRKKGNGSEVEEKGREEEGEEWEVQEEVGREEEGDRTEERRDEEKAEEGAGDIRGGTSS